jgi:uncharacterized protein (TIGR02118 family)
MNPSLSPGIRVSVFYPADADGRFDIDYYVEKHVPMAFKLMEAHGCRRMSVERGIAGGAVGSSAPFTIVGHMDFDSTEAFQAAMTQVGAEIQADVPNYTERLPTIQIAEILDVRP